MRLRIARAAAEEQLAVVINGGYQCLNEIENIYAQKSANGEFNAELEMPLINQHVQAWAQRVCNALQGIFPTDLEWNFFKTQEASVTLSYAGINQQYATLRDSLKPHIARLHAILNSHIARYTDLPLKERVFVEDIDSFQKVRDVNPSMVASHLTNGCVALSEDQVQLGIEAILDVSFHKKDWGGEANDLYTANVVVNGMRRPTAFLLKGPGIKSSVMEIKHCGKNGDQVVRLFQNPADLYVIQFVGNVSEAVIQHAHSETARIRSQGRNANFLIIDGQDTARLLHAYGKL